MSTHRCCKCERSTNGHARPWGDGCELLPVTIPSTQVSYVLSGTMAITIFLSVSAGLTMVSTVTSTSVTTVTSTTASGPNQVHDSTREVCCH